MKRKKAYLYQMSSQSKETNERGKPWGPTPYLECQEGVSYEWGSHKIQPHFFDMQAGDKIFLFFVPFWSRDEKGKNCPGIYGFGEIEKPATTQEDTIIFVLLPGSEELKNDPLFNADLYALVKKIRGTRHRATMFEIYPEDLQTLDGMIKAHLKRIRRLKKTA